MQQKLVINNQDFSRYLKADGLTFGETYRQSRDVVVLDGTLYKARITRMVIDVSLVELRDNTLAMLSSALQSVSPASVQYTDAGGVSRTALFYASDLSYSAKTVCGGNTYYSGAGFSLEEK